MKLELKYVLPYLEYKLKALDTVTKEIREVTIEHQTYDTKTVGLFLLIKSEPLMRFHKPILRPLKEIYQVQEIMDEFSEYHLELFETSFFILGIGCTNRFDHVNVTQYNSMLKNHFDVFGLIEKGLAIDINTLD